MVMVKRRAPPQRRGPGRKRMRMTRPVRPRVRAPMMMVSRKRYLGTWDWGTATTAEFWRYYQPTANTDFNGFAEFAAVFDLYKVNALKLTFIPRWDNADFSSSTAGTVQFITHIDPQSALVPSGSYGTPSLNFLLEEGGRIKNGLRTVDVYWKPQISLPANIGSGVYYRPCPWLRTQDTTTTMRGVHCYVNPTNQITANPILYDVYLTWYVAFKNVK